MNLIFYYMARNSNLKNNWPRYLIQWGTWTTTYAGDNVKEEPAKLGFDRRGVSYPVE